MEAKAKRKPIPKVAHTSQIVGERLCLDLTGRFNTPAYGGTRYALVIEDQYSKMTWTYPLKKKNCLHDHLNDLLAMNKTLGFPCRYLRMDNAGENIKACFSQDQAESLRIKYGFEVEQTTAYTPQQNGQVERKISTLHDGAMAMCVDAKLSDATRAIL